MTDFAKMRSSLHTALDRLGHRNSHACPLGGTNSDPYLHELFVANEGRSHFDKRYKAAIKEALMVAGDSEADAVKPGTEQSILEGEHYSLVVKKNNPAQRIDRTKIGNALNKRGFDEAKVLLFMAEISVETKAATSVRAVAKG